MNTKTKKVFLLGVESDLDELKQSIEGNLGDIGFTLNEENALNNIVIKLIDAIKEIEAINQTP